MLGPDEYRERAYNLKMNNETKDLLQKLASGVLGTVVGAGLYYNWTVGTSKREAEKPQN
jgi:hypothetical protein